MTATLYLPEPLTHQAEWLDADARFKLLRIGRRGGKSRGKLLAALDGHGPRDPVTGEPKYPGVLQGAHGVWLTPDYPQSVAIWREEIKPRLGGLPGVTINESMRRVEFAGLGSLELRSAENVDSIRGRRLDFALPDEAAYMDLEYAWNAVLRPALADNKGWAIFGSTPNAGDDGNAAKVVPSYFNRLCIRAIAGQLEGDWAHFHAPTSANPKITRTELAAMYAEYGDGSRVAQQELDALLLDAQAADQLIRMEWLEAAALRHEQQSELRRGEPALGVDVANSDAGDRGAISFWRGHVMLDVRAFPCPNANRLGAEVHGLAVSHTVRDTRICVDAGGVGAGTVNELRRLGVQHVNAFHAGGKASGDGAERFLNARAAAYWLLREDLRLGRIGMKRDAELFNELTNVRFEDRLGVIVVEPKSEIRKRLGGKSPDKADAVVYGNWVRDRNTYETVERNFDQHPDFVQIGSKVYVNEGKAKQDAEANKREFRPRYSTPRYGRVA